MHRTAGFLVLNFLPLLLQQLGGGPLGQADTPGADQADKQISTAPMQVAVCLLEDLALAGTCKDGDR